MPEEHECVWSAVVSSEDGVKNEKSEACRICGKPKTADES